LRLKLFGVALVILVGTVGAFFVVERIRGVSGLGRRVAQLKQQGEKLSIADYEPARSNPDEDAAGALLALSNRFASANSLGQIAPPTGRFGQPGLMIRVTALQSWSYEKQTNSWSDVVGVFAEDDSLNKDLHLALRLPGWNDGSRYDNGFIDFQMGPLALWRSLSQRLALSALAALRNNDVESAVARIEDAGCLLKHQSNSPLIVNQLVRIAEAAIIWNATWEVVTSGRCSEPQLARVQAAWDGMDFNTDMSLAMAMERNMTLVHYDLIISSAQSRSKSLEELAQAVEFGLGSRPPTSGFVLHHIHVPVWLFSWARQDELRSLNRWQAVIEFDRKARSQSWSGASDRKNRLEDEAEFLASAIAGEDGPRMNVYDRYRYLFSGMTFAIGSATTRKSMQNETQRRLLVTAVAIERWKLRRGVYPRSLNELVPALLPAVPVDLMNNQPFRYKLTPDDIALLYSVGDDGRDDGGEAQPSDATATYRRIWDGKDAVWPRPASGQDAQRASNSE